MAAEEKALEKIREKVEIEINSKLTREKFKVLVGETLAKLDELRKEVRDRYGKLIDAVLKAGSVSLKCVNISNDVTNTKREFDGIFKEVIDNFHDELETIGEIDGRLRREL